MLLFAMEFYKVQGILHCVPARLLRNKSRAFSSPSLSWREPFLLKLPPSAIFLGRVTDSAVGSDVGSRECSKYDRLGSKYDRLGLDKQHEKNITAHRLSNCSTIWHSTVIKLLIKMRHLLLRIPYSTQQLLYISSYLSLLFSSFPQPR